MEKQVMLLFSLEDSLLKSRASTSAVALTNL